MQLRSEAEVWSPKKYSLVLIFFQVKSPGVPRRRSKEIEQSQFWTNQMPHS